MDEQDRHREHPSRGATLQAADWREAILESFPFELWAADRRGQCVEQNGASRRRLGDQRGQPVMALAPTPAEAKALAAAVARAATGEWVREEVVELVDDLPQRRLRLVGPCRREDELIGALGVELDVTSVRAGDEAAWRALRLDSLGLLAGGIAHDFNNLLMAVVGHISLSRMHQRAGGAADALLDEAERACLRAQALTQQLLTFARGGQAVREAVRIGDLVRDSASFAASGSNCVCTFAIPDDLEPVLADLGQLHQVINNLVLNAVQAMPQGGAVAIDARSVTVDAGGALRPGRYVALSVRDRGVGIPPEQLPRVFDPYFTTAPVGQGLGLAVAYAIVHRHQGTIEIVSTPGDGTAVTVYLPAADKALGSRLQPRPETTAVHHGSGPVLVLDDEAAVRSVTAVMLKSLGYVPVSAASCSEAAAICARAREEQRPIRLAILDLTIPGSLGGTACLRRLREVEPELRAIVTSGFTNDPVLADYRAHGFADVLTKPFSRERLAAVLERVRGGDAAPGE